jgi:hypothetical protein
MAIIGTSSATGITTANNNNDVVYKEYQDNKASGVPATTASDYEKVLINDGSSSSWQNLSVTQKYESSGSFSYTVPDRVNNITITAIGGGGGGDISMLDGSTIPKASSWAARTGAFNWYQYYYSVLAYGATTGEKFLSGQQSAYIETSTDAVAWTKRTHGNTGNNSYWRDASFLNNNFHLLGYNGAYSISTDAIHWTMRTTGTTQELWDFDYDGSTNYMFVGKNGVCSVSTDTIHWKLRTTSFATTWTISCKYASSQWLIGSQYGKLATSTDTINWDRRTLGATTSVNIYNFNYHDAANKYLAFTNYGASANTGGFNTYGSGAHTSTDAIHWERPPIIYTKNPTNYKIFYDSFYSSKYNLIVAAGGGSAQPVITSTDAVHWNSAEAAASASASTYELNAIVGNDDLLLVSGQYWTSYAVSNLKLFTLSGGGGGASARLKYNIQGSDISRNSTLDITVGAGGRGGGKVHSEQWTLRTMGISTNRLEENGYPAVNGNQHWVVGSKISASTDSIHWSARTVPLPSSTQAWGVAFGDTLLMTSGDNYFLCTSTDSIAWTLRTTSLDDNREMFYDGKETWLVGGKESTNGLVTSTDTIHWKRRTLGGTLARQVGFAYNFETYVVGTYISNTGKSNGLSSSTDTIHWTKRTIGFGALNTKKVAYNSDTEQFYIVGEGNGLFASTDAIHWAKRTVPFGNSNVIYSYSTGYNQHVIGSKDGIATSTDSINWTLRTHNFTEAEPRYVGYGDSKFMITNNSGASNYKNEVAILDVSAQDGESTIISWKGKGETTMTNNGGVSVDTTIKPTGKSSSYSFDGSNDNLSLPINTDFSFGTGDLTVEAWFKADSSATESDYHTIISCGFPVQLYWYDNKFQFFAASANSATYFVNGADFNSGNNSAVRDVWYHIAVTRSGNDFKMFLNGALVDSASSSTSFAAPNVETTIGSTATGGSYANFADGKISNLRITKGKALYTGAFTPPTGDLQFGPRTVLLTCQTSEIVAFSDDKDFNYTVPGGNAANFNTGGSELSWPLPSSALGYTYAPYATNNTTFDNWYDSANSAFGFGQDGTTEGISKPSPYEYTLAAQNTSGGGGGGGNSLYPGSSGSGGYPQTVTVGESNSTFQNSVGGGINGVNGIRISGNDIFGSGGFGGMSLSQPSVPVNSFSIRTNNASVPTGTSLSNPRSRGYYVEHLDLFMHFFSRSQGKKSLTGLQVSTDTIHWVLRTFPLATSTGGDWHWQETGLGYNPPAASDGNQIVVSNQAYSSTAHTLASSTDTIHWTLRTSAKPPEFQDPNGLGYGNNVWIQSYRVNDITTSTDAIHWELRTFGNDTKIGSFAYGSGTWVANSAYNTYVFTSTDAIHWKARTSGIPSSYRGYQLAYGNGRFAYGTYRNISYSTDGISWTARSQENMHYVYGFGYYPNTNQWLIIDYYGRGFVSDFDIPAHLNWQTSSGYFQDYVNNIIVGANGKKTIIPSQDNDAATYGIYGAVLQVGAGNGGNGVFGGGGGGAGSVAKATLSGQGGDGGDGAVHISSI